MSYSRRQLEAFGETLGDCVTRKEGGRVIYGSGGGGGGSGTTTQVTDVPDWAKPFAKEALGVASSLAFKRDAEGNISGFQPYQQYQGERTAQFTPLQQRSFEGATNLQTSAATGQGINLTNQAANRAMNAGAGFNPYQAQNAFNAPGQYQSGQFSMGQVQSPELQQLQMAGPERVNTQSFAQPGSAEQYMNPYMQNVVDAQKREATRSSEMMRNQQQAQAVSQGAFGGSRQAIVEAERQRNLGTQLGDIQATGSQAAYQNAQQQFNQEQAARLQAQQANQQAGLSTGQQNLAAQLGVQQLGSGQNLQAQLANQQALLANQQAAEQSRQFGYGQQMTAAQQQAQYAQSAQQLAEQSRQFGGSLGLQGLQAAMQGGNQLGSLGGQQFAQQKDVLGLQNQFGLQQQQQVQNILSQKQQDFLDQQRYPYQQVEFMSNILRGTPMGTTQTIYAPQPGIGQQLVGAGTAMYGASRLMAKGGPVSDAKVKRETKRSSLVDLALSKMA